MHERFKKSKRWLRGGAALCALALVSALACAPAAAAGVPARKLVPVGHTVGIKLFSRGVLVVALQDGGTPAKACGLETGDVIVKCGGAAVTSSEQFQDLIRQTGGNAVELEVRRTGSVRTLAAQPEKTETGEYAIGAWIRDSMAGIGTMTFYDPESGQFGALGHGVTDADTAQLMPLSSGAILPSSVKAVRRGEAGAAGELRGEFDLTRELGALCANTDGGVFGTLDAPGSLSAEQALPVARAEQVCDGPAEILSNVTGDQVGRYAVSIARIPSDGGKRDLLVTVTDPALLTATGGIVQGMSGSPILQNGRFVGAITHVLLNDPTKGYGILIETMLKAAENGQ